MTCTPVPTEHADGSISYHFETDDHSHATQGTEIFENDEAYYQDEQGNHHHILEDVDFEQFERLDDSYVEELSSADFDSGVTTEDMTEIIDGIGLEEFSAMNSWAHTNLNPQAQARLESILATGDVPAITDAFNSLYAFYQENSEYSAPKQRTPQPSQRDEAITNNLQSIVGGANNYNQLIAMARETFSDEQIERYNYIMDNGSHQDRATAVRWLGNQFN